MERREISTAISDLILCLSASRCAYHGHYEWDFPNTTVAGFLAISVAAGLGFLRFGQLTGDMHGAVSSLHDIASYVAAVSGMALIADGYVTAAHFQFLKWPIHACVSLGLLGYLVLSAPMRARVKDIAGPISLAIVIAMCLLSCRRNVINYYGIIGCGCFIIGGLLMMTSRTVLGSLKVVDVFHYLAAFGSVMLAGGLRWKTYNC